MFRSLSNLQHLQVVIYQPGLGGMFLCNLLNLADSAVNKQCMDLGWRAHMYHSINGKMQHEMNTTFQSSKIFFDGLHSDCQDNQIDLWLADIELRLLLSTHEFWKLENYDTWLSDPLAVVKHRTIYCPEHAPGRLQGALTSSTLDRIAARALQHGITVRFVIATVYDAAHQSWAHQRENHMVHTVSLPTWMQRQVDQYQEGLNSPYAMELCLDSFLHGDVESLLQAVSKLTVGPVDDVDLIRARAVDFLKHKRLA